MPVGLPLDKLSRKSIVRLLRIAGGNRSFGRCMMRAGTDLNADGCIDIFDELCWAGYFNQSCTP